MTYPTRAVCPILLEDFRKITTERKGETNFFTSDMIKASMKKVIAVDLQQTIKVDNELEIKAFYAGHVLGAAMFYVKVGELSCLYTGDYNMTPDRHLGSAKIEKLRVDLLITETTYATTIRDSKRLREREFLKNCHDTVARGGKVLIPVFALGRAQELCILIESYWERMNLSHIPVYFSAGLVERANLYYKLFINWTNQKIKNTFVQHNMFDFKHIKPFDKSYIERPGPYILFATPGMLHAGMSLEVFKKWCGNELNTCILPGFCVSGTVGNKILSKNKRIEIDKKTTVDVNCQVKSLSFSAHADAKGIMTLIQQCEPKNVMLVHGEKAKMKFLKKQIIDEFKIPCFDPANGEVLTVNLYPNIPLDISRSLIKRDLQDEGSTTSKKSFGKNIEIEGVLVMNQNNQSMKLIHPEEAQRELGITQHQLIFKKTIPFNSSLWGKLNSELIKEGSVATDDKTVIMKSIIIQLTDDGVKFQWSFKDEDLVLQLFNITTNLTNEHANTSKNDVNRGISMDLE